MADLREKIRTLTTRVGGRTPFTGEIWSGITRPGIKLAYNQYFRIFSVVCSDEPSLWPNVKPRLPPGETYHLVELNNGGDMPATILKGHTLFMFLFTWLPSRLVRHRFVLDGQMNQVGLLETLINNYGFSNVIVSTELLDPTASVAHTFDLTVENLDDKPLEGYLGYLAVDTILGSEFPEMKTVKCKWCGATKKVKNETTRVRCDVCGKETWYYPLMRGGRLG